MTAPPLTAVLEGSAAASYLLFVTAHTTVRCRCDPTTHSPTYSLPAQTPRRPCDPRSQHTCRGAAGRSARATPAVEKLEQLNIGRARVQSRRSTLEETAERVAIAATKARSDVAQRLTKRQYSFACVSVDVVGRRHTGVQR